MLQLLLCQALCVACVAVSPVCAPLVKMLHCNQHIPATAYMHSNRTRCLALRGSYWSLLQARASSLPLKHRYSSQLDISFSKQYIPFVSHASRQVLYLLELDTMGFISTFAYRVSLNKALHRKIASGTAFWAATMPQHFSIRPFRLLHLPYLLCRL